MALVHESGCIAQNIGNFTGSVNGQITGCVKYPQRSFYRSMELRQVLNRIERRLKAVGISADAASRGAGKPDAIRNIRRAVKDGTRQGVSTTTIAALAPTLYTTIGWITEGAGREDVRDLDRTIPVWGKAGAGGKVYHFHEGGVEIGRISAPESTNENTSAVEIAGDSLGQIFNGWYAIYDEIRTPPTIDLVGRLCVLETFDGIVYIKTLKKGKGKRFTLLSNYEPPIYDVELIWAARVKNLVPE